jgi:hypothetical protein
LTFGPDFPAAVRQLQFHPLAIADCRRGSYHLAGVVAHKGKAAGKHAAVAERDEQLLLSV